MIKHLKTLAMSNFRPLTMINSPTNKLTVTQGRVCWVKLSAKQLEKDQTDFDMTEVRDIQ